MSNRLAHILNEVAQLAPDERQILIDRLLGDDVDMFDRGKSREWSSLRGALPYAPSDEDAQAWVARLRCESDQRGNP